ncbi:MAG: tyrosine--tRNA ligase [Candidatus Pacebacteria bacterium]|nr:tyrosine--tRNA ligase [Candidatus Paceibacterota bacterium]
MSVFTEMEWRGEIHQVTSPDLAEKINQGGLTLYVGYDPTGASLHIGHLATLITLVRLQLAGHRVIPLIGDGTAPIGDPSGKSAERNLQSIEAIDQNALSIKSQIAAIFKAAGVSNFKFEHNAKWLRSILLFEFLRDTGKHFSVNAMMQKDSVKQRLEREGVGISFTEFSYALLQARDFLELYQREGCVLQLGGSDQMGNIVGGVDLIRRIAGVQAFGATSPLILDSNGQKFGKTEKGAVFLDRKMTSVFAFYQFWINVSDADCLMLLKRFTLLPRAEIAALEPEIGQPTRLVQKTLARSITTMVHGAADCERVIADSEILFYGKVAEISAATRAELLESDTGIPTLIMDRSESRSVVDMLVEMGLCESKGDARRQIAQKAIRINDEVVVEGQVFGLAETDHSIARVSRGKKNFGLILG